MVNQQGSPFYSEDAHAMQRSHKRIASTFQISRVYQAHIPTFAAGYWLFGLQAKSTIRWMIWIRRHGTPESSHPLLYHKASQRRLLSSGFSGGNASGGGGLIYDLTKY